MVKPLKIALWDPICTTKWSAWAMPKMKNNFFSRNNKSRSSAFWNFLFCQNIIHFGWVMNLFLFCVIFFIKKGSFPGKTAICNYIRFFKNCIYSLSWAPTETLRVSPVKKKTVTIKLNLLLFLYISSIEINVLIDVNVLIIYQKFKAD